MKNKKETTKNRYCLLVLLVGLLVSVGIGRPVKADTTYPTGKLEPQKVELPEGALHVRENTSGRKGSAVYNSQWDKYRTWFWYNQMTDAQKEVYDELDKICMSFLTDTTNADSEKYKGKMYYYTKAAESAELSEEEMTDLLLIFRVSNPQYYFLSSGYVTGTLRNKNVIAPCVYPAFAKGSDRMNATGNVKIQAEIWEAEAEQYATDAEKVKVLHDLIAEKVTYNYEAAEDMSLEDTAYTQSSYSVLCTDKTVCAGYSQAMAMLCNAVGVDAVCVTSLEHEWNKARIDGTWYNIDVTWDDRQDGYGYEFFERDDNYYDTVDFNSAQYHKEESCWDGLLPVCDTDAVFADTTFQTPGTLPVVTDTVAVPTVSIKKSGSTYKLTMKSSTPGAEFWYTTDGSLPAPASRKSIKYQKAFTATSISNLRVMASRGGMWDSADVQYSYVVYNGNKSTSGSMAMTLVTDGTVKLSANAFQRKGYTFTGWNTKANGKGKAYKKNATVTNLTSGLVLYAQWEAVKYKITYNLKGGKNSKKNPSYYYVTTKTIKLEAPKKKGYTFAGWYTDKKYKKKITKIKKGSTGKLTLYAKWVKK